ncbi:SRPBCC family protein [Kutzneria buriramensis]|uniref:Polyketide cyclase/dehydrase/lipid transport protein n=1 Tax=Kutzneria buriramensis TaxID=1045776 RepID=A0A3E0GXG1_9PSEU|nr:SRPBCC family protein [Kutzneria buriramensis]REH33080.1 polyketide cyclase/dehydrase/lipid transport protein [Kutzneria buriramensis]
MTEDDAGRPLIHWPAGFTPERADCFCHAETTVPAPPAVVFDVLTDVAAWPSWVPGVSAITHLGGPLRTQCTFDVDMRGERFEVLVAECRPPNRVGWTAIAAEVQVYQSWLLVAARPCTRVITEVVAVGPVAAAYRESRPSWSDNITRHWLHALGMLAEKKVRTS